MNDVFAAQYVLGERLHESRGRIVHRAVDTAHQRRPVILKQVCPNAIDAAELQRLRHEKDLLQGLDCPGITRLLDYSEHGSDAVLVLEDIGGQSVAHSLNQKRFSLRQTLRIAADVARALGSLHARGIVHKDVAPTNIAVTPDFRVELFDLDIAARLPRSTAGLPSPTKLEGTLAYMAPEQTGRMQRSLDERSDLYALGATLFEMLTGRPPFVGDDALDVVHAHLARAPVSVCELEPSIPGVVGQIVDKLLQKAAEDRYQGALGVEHDLRVCLERLDDAGNIAPFALAQHDIPARLRLPDRLYGRDVEVAALEKSFLEVLHNKPRLTVVSGRAGVGKSSLVQAFARKARALGGVVAMGDFEKDKQHRPYGAFVEAIQSLVRAVFSAGEDEVTIVRERAVRTLRAGARPLIDLIPELALILGELPPLPPNSPAPTRERMRLLFQELLRAFVRPDKPLLLVLDNADWADAASLDLLTALIDDETLCGLMVVVAVRGDELLPTHLLTAALGALEKNGHVPRRTDVGPLSVEAIANLLSDTLGSAMADVLSLAELAWKKTDGNALFVEVFLATIHRDGLLAFDAVRGCWTWDTAAIAALPVTENVARVLMSRVGELRETSRVVLQMAAILGGDFDKTLVAAMANMDVESVEQGLEEAGREGLVTRAEGSFRFAHQRIRDAIAASLGAERRAELQLDAGRTLIVLKGENAEDLPLFEVLGLMDGADDLALRPDERLILARLGLHAGKRARASAALEAAEVFFQRAQDRLPSDAWTNHRELALEILRSATECAYSSGRYEEGERRFGALFARAETDIERARLHGMHARACVGPRRFVEAIESTREGARLMGLRIPKKPSLPLILLALAKAQRAVGKRSVDELLALPPMQDTRVLTALDVISNGLAAAYIYNRQLYALLTLEGVALLAKHGNGPMAPHFYSFYAFFVAAILRDIPRALEMARFAGELVEKNPHPVHESRVLMQRGIFFQHYRGHLRDALPDLEMAQSVAFSFGENIIMGTCSSFIVSISLQTGVPLENVISTGAEICQMVKRTGQTEFGESVRLNYHVALALQGKTNSLGSLTSAEFDEQKHAARVATGSVMATLHLRYWQGYLWNMFEKPRKALAIFDEIDGVIAKEFACLYYLGEYLYQRALVLAAVASEEGLRWVEREKLVFALRSTLRKLGSWVEHSPENFTHKHALARAELARVTGDADGALRAYEEAISGAKKAGFVQDEGVANERAGRFFLSRTMDRVGMMYLAAARRAFVRWGATAKIALLDERWPTLAMVTNTPSLSVKTTTNRDSNAALDAPSMLEATRALSGEISLEKLLARLMEIVTKNAGATHAALLVRENASDLTRMVLRADVTAGKTPQLYEPPVPLENAQSIPLSVIRWCVQTKESVLLANAPEEGAFVGDPHVTARRPRSILAMPMVRQGELIGVLYLENALVAETFTQERAAFVAVLCAQMAISIENALLYADLERKVHERTRDLREAQERIIALEKDATEVLMAGGFAHEMRNALAGARMLLTVTAGDEDQTNPCLETTRHLRTVYEGIADVLPDAEHDLVQEQFRLINGLQKNLDDVLRRVSSAVSRGMNITTEILEYSKIRGGEGHECAFVRPIVESIVDDQEKRLALSMGEESKSPKNVVFDVDIAEDVAFAGSADHLHSMLNNLVDNAKDAVLAAHRADVGHVRISATNSFTTIDIRVQDDGIGMAGDVQGRIFEPFFSTKPRTGMGLGLSIVRKLVTTYRGSISHTSKEGGGTTFRLELPRAHTKGEMV